MKIEVKGKVGDYKLARVSFSYVYLPEISKFAVQKHEYNGSNSPIYFDERKDALDYIKKHTYETTT